LMSVDTTKPAAPSIGEAKASQSSLTANSSIDNTQEPEEPEFLQMINGEFVCTLCDARMNNREMRDSHFAGQRHRKALLKYETKRRRTMGNAGLRGAKAWAASKGGGHVNRGDRIAQVAVPVEESPQDKQKRAELARSEYDRILAEALARKDSDQSAQEQALQAMNAILSGSIPLHQIKQEPGTTNPPPVSLAVSDISLGNGVKTEENLNKNQWPPPYVTVVVKPRGFKPGTYKCELCDVTLASEPNLEAHINSPGHKEEEEKPPSLRKRNQGKVFVDKVRYDNIVKAQRGRRGLISSGEIMPHKLNKSEKREQADIAKSIEKHLNSQTGDVKVLPLLMNFIKGETIQPEIDFK